MDSKGTVICFGMAVVDLLVKGVKNDVFLHEVTRLDRFAYATGGDAMNEATIIARMGHKVKLMSLVGDDLFGRFIVETGEKNGIDMLGVKMDKSVDTTLSIVLIDDDGNRVFVANKGSDQCISADVIDYEAIKQADIIAVGSAFTCEKMDRAIPDVLKFAKSYGLTTCVDVMAREGATVKDMADFLPYADYIFPNYDEAAIFTGESELVRIANKFLTYGVRNVVIKIGDEGCYIRNNNTEMTVPGFKAACIDTTGAGDNFAAGFITALLEKKDIAQCARFANAVASVSVQYMGANGIKNREEVEARMAGEA
jgi:sugar/nucleoside kinase (ribokinase family)